MTHLAQLISDINRIIVNILLTFIVFKFYFITIKLEKPTKIFKLIRYNILKWAAFGFITAFIYQLLINILYLSNHPTYIDEGDVLLITIIGTISSIITYLWDKHIKSYD